MKMTRLEWRYLQRIALDHPYYDTHKPPLSDAEARAIVEANNTMTGKEFVDSIYAKLGMTRPIKEKKRFAWLSNLGELFTVPPIRKIAIAILVVLLMTVFFAATPTGRAIAESVIRYIVILFEDGRLVVNQSDRGTALAVTDDTAVSVDDDWQETENSVEYLDSIEGFINATNKDPALLSLSYYELYYDFDQLTNFLELYISYEGPKGSIITTQIWNMSDLTSSTSAGFTIYESDPSIYYSVEEEGNIYIMKFFEDSVFEIITQGDYTVDELINYLNNEVESGCY